MSKGSTYRPLNKKKFDENYERIFRKNDQNNKQEEDKLETKRNDDQDQAYKVNPTIDVI